jgi:predicted NBD/HSP70 family sugar kinase
MRQAPRAPVLVVEVGGTSVRAACFDPGRQALERFLTAPTPNHLDGERPTLQQEVLEAMGALAARVLDGDEPTVVAVAYPGPLDEAGRVLATPTVLGEARTPFELQQACEELWPGAAVYTMNDLTAAGYRYVAGGLRDFAVVTVGSGIGHKVFLDGRPRVGPGSRGGEIGHLRLDFTADAPLCDCGGRGHLGGLASGRGTVSALRRRAAAEPAAYAASALRQIGDARQIDGAAVAAAYRADDAFTVAGVRDAARYLGQGLAAIHLDTGVERIILVGGFALALGESYRKLVAAAAEDASWQIGQDWDAIVGLGEGDDPGLLGGGLFASGLVDP